MKDYSQYTIHLVKNPYYPEPSFDPMITALQKAFPGINTQEGDAYVNGEVITGPDEDMVESIFKEFLHLTLTDFLENFPPTR